MLARITHRFGRLFKKEKKRGVGAHPMFQPERDWLVIIVVFIIINLFIGLTAWYIFTRIEAGAFFAGVTTQEKTSDARLQKNELTNIIEYYEQKQKRFDAFRNDFSGTFDPS